jgi:hypothetical protein
VDYHFAGNEPVPEHAEAGPHIRVATRLDQALEVLKDWHLTTITEADPACFTIDTGSGHKVVPNPLEQARQYSRAVVEVLRRDWLATALRLQDSGLRQLKTGPLLDPLRKEPRFQAIERQLQFPN